MILAARYHSAVLGDGQTHNRRCVRRAQSGGVRQFAHVPYSNFVARRRVQFLLVQAQGQVVDRSLAHRQLKRSRRSRECDRTDLSLTRGEQRLYAVIASSQVPNLDVRGGHAEQQSMYGGVLHGDDVIRVTAQC